MRSEPKGPSRRRGSTLLVGVAVLSLIAIGCRELRLPQAPISGMEFAWGLVLDDAERPVSEARIELWTGMPDREGGQIHWIGETDEEGVFRSSVIAGRYDVYVRPWSSNGVPDFDVFDVQLDESIPIVSYPAIEADFAFSWPDFGGLSFDTARAILRYRFYNAAGNERHGTREAPVGPDGLLTMQLPNETRYLVDFRLTLDGFSFTHQFPDSLDIEDHGSFALTLPTLTPYDLVLRAGGELLPAIPFQVETQSSNYTYREFEAGADTLRTWAYPGPARVNVFSNADAPFLWTSFFLDVVPGAVLEGSVGEHRVTFVVLNPARQPLYPARITVREPDWTGEDWLTDINGVQTVFLHTYDYRVNVVRDGYEDFVGVYRVDGPAQIEIIMTPEAVE